MCAVVFRPCAGCGAFDDGLLVWLQDGDRHGVPQRPGVDGDCGNESGRCWLARIHRRSARGNVVMSKANKLVMEFITRHEINWNDIVVGGDAGVGQSWCFRTKTADVGGCEAVGGDFQSSRITGDDPVADWLAHGARFEAARGPAECEAVCGFAVLVGGWVYRSDGWAGGPAFVGRVAGRLRKRRVLPAEYSDRGVFHDSAQRSRGRRGARVQAALASRHADREIRCRFEGGKNCGGHGDGGGGDVSR